MAKSFYSADEAAAKLGVGTEELVKLAREGKIREFRDAGKVNYRVDEIDAMAVRNSAQESGELVLEPAEEDSGLELALGSGSDVLSLDDVDRKADAARKKEDRKEGTVVPSVGVSVFDDDELDELVDPLAQTQVSEAGIGFEGIGSGSGILDLTRESDDTSLGAELLDEIVPTEEDTLEMGDATRAGLVDAIAEDTADEAESLERTPAIKTRGGARPAAVTRVRTEYAPDAASTALTGMLFVGLLISLVGLLTGASMVRGVQPAILSEIHKNLAIFAGGSAGVALLVGAISYFVARRS